MTDEATVIHSILFFNFDFNCKNQSNRSKLNNSRDDNDLLRIKLITTYEKRFKRFHDFSNYNFTIDFNLY